MRLAIDKGFGAIEDLKIDDLKKISPLFEEDIFAKITPEACMEARKTTGGPSPEMTEKQISILKTFAEKYL